MPSCEDVASIQLDCFEIRDGVRTDFLSAFIHLLRCSPTFCFHFHFQTCFIVQLSKYLEWRKKRSQRPQLRPLRQRRRDRAGRYLRGYEHQYVCTRSFSPCPSSTFPNQHIKRHPVMASQSSKRTAPRDRKTARHHHNTASTACAVSYFAST